MAMPGDVFATRQPKGQYGAVRIIRKRGKEYLAYCSIYLGRKRPSLADPALRRWVIQRRFEYASEPALCWIEEAPPKTLELIGNLSPSAAEKKRRCETYGTGWSAVTDDVYYEWRWRHDRKNYEREEFAARARSEAGERAQRRRQNPKEMMELPAFWTLIAQLDWRHKGKESKVIAPVVETLATKSVRTIKNFEERLATLLYQLDTKAHSQRASASPDGFLYSRCACVANGPEFYDSVRANPKKMPLKTEFESLLGIAATAYEKKTGREFDYRTGRSYETGSNLKGWPEADK